jgi:HK97 family phage prohead protease
MSIKKTQDTEIQQEKSQMNTTLSAPFELKFLAESGTFEGYASVFGVTDNMNDMIARGAFRASLAQWRVEGRLPPMLWQHDAAAPVGAWETMFEDSHGLFVKGRLFVADIARAREAYRLMKEKVVTGLSIGYRAKQSHADRATGARVLTEVELMEVSMVTFPANEMARVASVKSGGHAPTEREFEALLREAGFSRKQAKGVIASGYRSLMRDAGGEDEVLTGVKALTDMLWRMAE